MSRSTTRSAVPAAGLTMKIHHACDGKGRPLVMLLGPGRGGDAPMLPNVLAAIRVPRPGPGRPRTRPDTVIADKAYSSRANRALLRSRHITAVIPEPSDQAGHRTRRGRHGGRPVSYYRGRNGRTLLAAGVRRPCGDVKVQVPRSRLTART